MLVTSMTPLTLVVTCLFWSYCHGSLHLKDITGTLNPQMQPAAATVSEISTLHTTMLTACALQCLQHSDCIIAVHSSTTCTLMSPVADVTLETCMSCTTIHLPRQHLLYRNTRASDISVYDTFTSEDAVNNEHGFDYKTLANEPSGVFKSNLATNAAWSLFTKIRVAMYTDGVEMFYILFDNVGATKDNWFARHRILESTATDLTPSSTSEFFSLNGFTTASISRRFYIMTNAHCPGDHGWLSVTDVGHTDERCSWEIGAHPMFFYSPSAADQLYQDMASAEVFVIFGIF